MYQPALRTDTVANTAPSTYVHQNSRDRYHNHSADSTHTPSETFFPAANIGYLYEIHETVPTRAIRVARL